MKYFLNQWKIITNDQEILKLIKGWDIPFIEMPVESLNQNSFISRDNHTLIDKEISEMLEKGAIQKTSYERGQVLSSLFLREKKDGTQRPILNLKKLNQNIPYLHFKMESLKDVKNIIQEGDWMVKIDMKDAYFTVPLSQKSQKYVRFKWRNQIYKFLCLCFGIGPAPRLFTKLLKVLTSVLRRLNIRLVIYLDDILIFGSSKEEIEMTRDTTLYLLENLGFIVNLKKSELNPSQIMEYLGVVIDSLKMTMSLTEKKINSLSKLCTETLNKGSCSIRELSRVLGKLISTAAAVTPCMLQVRHLQQLQIQGLKTNGSYGSLITLDKNSKLELMWWIENLHLRIGKPILTSSPDLIIYSDAATSGGWGAFCQGQRTGGQWTQQEKCQYGDRINMLELMAADLAIRTFVTQHPKAKNIHLMIDNKTALAYLLKMGGTTSIPLMEKTKSIWEFLLSKGLNLTAEYLPTDLNTEADYESGHVQNWTEWKLCPSVFQKVCLQFGHPDIDLFASRVSHQIPQYMSLKN